MPTDKPGFKSYRKKVRARVALNLRRRRESLGLSQERAAERAGLSLQYLQRIERRIVNVPLDTLARLAHAYGVEPAVFLDLQL